MSQVQFGHETVTTEEKTRRVNDVFTSVSGVYDRMNNAMSFGVHHLWKQQAVTALGCSKNDRVIDLACGSGDISEILTSRIPYGSLFCIDPNAQMLAHCQQRLDGKHPQMHFIQSSAENLMLDHTVDKIIISFGLRNFSDLNLALSRIFTTLNPGGKIVIMEFNPPQSTMFETQYDMYLQKIIPFLGKLIGHDEDSYQYLADSIAVQPPPEKRIETLKSHGFQYVSHTPLTFGVVGLFEAYRCE